MEWLLHAKAHKHSKNKTMNLIIRLLVTAIVAYLLTKILTGVHFEGFSGAIIFAIVLGILNLILKPILSILGLPLTIITLGLFALVINAVIILIADYFIDSMKVDGFWWALIFSVLLSIITSLANSMFSDGD
jgi:putative membrane protein